jgi:hypothetical protein
MQPKFILLALPFVLAACGGYDNTRPGIVTPPAAVAPTTTIMPSSGSSTGAGMINQCRDLFAQSLAGQPVSYDSPSVTTVANLTTVRLTAVNAGFAGPVPYNYTCTFNGNMLTTAGRG